MNRKLRFILCALLIVGGLYSVNSYANEVVAIVEGTDCYSILMSKARYCTSPDEAERLCTNAEYWPWQPEQVMGGNCQTAKYSTDYGIITYATDNYSCHSIGTTAGYRIRSCNTCDSGYTRKKLVDVLQMENGNDVEIMEDMLYDVYSLCGGSLASSCTIPNDLYVCVFCRDAIGSWSSYSTNVVRRTKQNCGTTTYEYACKANTYKRSGNGSTIDCQPCPANATCRLRDGHTDSFTCNASQGYYQAGYACSRCPALDGYQGLYSSDNELCYIPEAVSITDLTGTYTFSNRCYYSASECDEYSYRNVLNDAFEDVLALGSTDYASEFDGTPLTAIVSNGLDVFEILDYFKDETDLNIDSLYNSMFIFPSLNGYWEELTVDEFFDSVIAAACAE